MSDDYLFLKCHYSEGPRPLPGVFPVKYKIVAKKRISTYL